jgi:hypothetical protein
MRKTCAQPVMSTWLTPRKSLALPTRRNYTNSSRGINPPVSHLALHTFVIQLYPTKSAQITDRMRQLSTLSTPPIIRAKQVRKENNSLGTRG